MTRDDGWAWLYGPRLREGPGELAMRSVVYDRTLLVEGFELIASTYTDAVLAVGGVNSGNEVFLDPAEIADASSATLRNASIYVPSLDLILGATTTHFLARSPEETRCARAWAELLLAEGRPRARIAQLLGPILIWVPSVALVATWLWFVGSQRPPASLFLLTAMLTVSAAGLARHAQPRWVRVLRWRVPPHVIRTESRAELYARRGDRHADLILAAITLPIGALLGALAAWFI